MCCAGICNANGCMSLCETVDPVDNKKTEPRSNEALTMEGPLLETEKE